MQRYIKVAAKHAIPLIPFSGGTSLEGHFNAPAFSKDGKTKVDDHENSVGRRFLALTSSTLFSINRGAQRRWFE
jgi:hypothetical protein